MARQIEVQDTHHLFGADGIRIANKFIKDESARIELIEYLQTKKRTKHWTDDEGVAALEALKKNKSQKYKHIVELLQEHELAVRAIWQGYATIRANELLINYERERAQDSYLYTGMRWDTARKQFLLRWYGPYPQQEPLESPKKDPDKTQQANRKSYPTPLESIDLFIAANNIDEEVSRQTSQTPPAEPGKISATHDKLIERIQKFMIIAYEHYESKGLKPKPFNDAQIEDIFEKTFIGGVRFAGAAKTYKSEKQNVTVTFQPSDFEGIHTKELREEYNQYLIPLVRTAWDEYATTKKGAETPVEVLARFKSDSDVYGKNGFTKTALDSIRLLGASDLTQIIPFDDVLVQAGEELVRELSERAGQDEPLTAAEVTSSLAEALQKPEDYPSLDREKKKIGKLSPAAARDLAERITKKIIERDYSKVQKSFKDAFRGMGEFITGLDVRRLFRRVRDPKDENGFKKQGHIKEAIDQAESDVRKEKPAWFENLPARSPADENRNMSRIERMFAHLRLVYDKDHYQSTKPFSDEEALDRFTKIYADPTTFECFKDDPTIQSTDIKKDFAEYQAEALRRIFNMWNIFITREFDKNKITPTPEQFYQRFEVFANSLLNPKSQEGFAKQGYTAGPIEQWKNQVSVTTRNAIGEPPKKDEAKKADDTNKERNPDFIDKAGDFFGNIVRAAPAAVGNLLSSINPSRAYYVRTWWLFDSVDDIKKLGEGPNNYPRQKGNIKVGYENIGEGYRPDFDKRWEDYFRKGKVEARFLAGFKLTDPCMCENDHVVGHAPHDFVDTAINPPEFQEGQIIALGVARLSPFDWRTYEMRATPGLGLAGRILSYNMERLVWKWDYQGRKPKGNEPEEKEIIGRVIFQQLTDFVLRQLGTNAKAATAQELQNIPSIGKSDVSVTLVPVQIQNGNAVPITGAKTIICVTDKEGRFRQTAPAGMYIAETTIGGKKFIHAMPDLGRPSNTPIQHTNNSDYEFVIIAIEEKETNKDVEGRVVEWEEIAGKYPNPTKDKPSEQELMDPATKGIDGAIVSAVFIPKEHLNTVDPNKIMQDALSSAGGGPKAVYPKAPLGLSKNGGYFNGKIPIHDDYIILIVAQSTKHETNHHHYVPQINPFGRPEGFLPGAKGKIIVPLKPKAGEEIAPKVWVHRVNDKDQDRDQEVTPKNNTCNLLYKAGTSGGSKLRVRLKITPTEPPAKELDETNARALFETLFMRTIKGKKPDLTADTKELMTKGWIVPKSSLITFKLELKIKKDTLYAQKYEAKLIAELLDENENAIAADETEYILIINSSTDAKRKAEDPAKTARKADKYVANITIQINNTKKCLPRVSQIQNTTTSIVNKIIVDMHEKDLPVFQAGRDTKEYINYMEQVLPVLESLHKVNNKTLVNWGITKDEIKLFMPAIDTIIGRIPKPVGSDLKDEKLIAYKIATLANDGKQVAQIEQGPWMLASFIQYHNTRRAAIYQNLKTNIYQFNVQVKKIEKLHKQIKDLSKAFGKKDIEAEIKTLIGLQQEVNQTLTAYRSTLEQIHWNLREFAAADAVLKILFKQEMLKEYLGKLQAAHWPKDVVSIVLGEQISAPEQVPQIEGPANS